MPTILKSFFIITAIAFVAPIDSTVAQKKKPKDIVALDPLQADEDYAYQGEFISNAIDRGIADGLTGLHVIALGDGQFDAVCYDGGLPGAGWNRLSDQSKYHGKRDGDHAVLNGDEGSIEITPDSAVIKNSDGETVDRLRRIHRLSPTLGTRPPYGAVVLFDGQSTDNLDGAKVTDDGLLLAGVTTKMPVQNFRLHLEFRTPYKPKARGQGRGNSGVYIQRRYELQVLDSFGLEGVHNECGGLYRQRQPNVNMCFPPLRWQTYDIYFTAARFDADGKKTDNAKITAYHNGFPIHDGYELKNKTGAGRKEGPEPLPIYLQDHGNPVTFRNYWIVPHDGHGGSACSCGCRSAFGCRH